MEITYNLNPRDELDGPPARNSSKFPKSFNISLDLKWEQVTTAVVDWQSILLLSNGLLHCFSSLEEQQELLTFAKG